MQFLEKTRVSSPEVPGFDPSYCPASSMQDFELHLFMMGYIRVEKLYYFFNTRTYYWEKW